MYITQTRYLEDEIDSQQGPSLQVILKSTNNYICAVSRMPKIGHRTYFDGAATAY